MKSKLKILGTLIIVVLLLADITYAAGGLVRCGNPGMTACTIPDLFRVIINIINYLLGLAGFVAMIFIVWSGWNMVSAAGNEEKITHAKESLSNSIIGLFLVLIMYVLLNGIIVILSGYTLTEALNFIFKTGP
jgi:hypothetical protein